MDYPMSLRAQEALDEHAAAIDEALPAQLDHLLERLDTAMSSVGPWASRMKLDEALWKEMRAERAAIPFEPYEINEENIPEQARAYALELVMRGGPACLRQNIARLRGEPEPRPSLFATALTRASAVLKRGFVIGFWPVLALVVGLLLGHALDFEEALLVFIAIGFLWLGRLIEKNSPAVFEAARERAEAEAMRAEWERKKIRFWDDRQRAYLLAKWNAGTKGANDGLSSKDWRTDHYR